MQDFLPSEERTARGRHIKITNTVFEGLSSSAAARPERSGVVQEAPTEKCSARHEIQAHSDRFIGRLTISSSAVGTAVPLLRSPSPGAETLRAYAPFGGTGASGNGARFGSQSSWDEFTQWRWLTLRDQAHGFPF